ncbi:hypothetical protein MOC32_14935 [Bacillus spizizenii]|nr:hypothetical protein [Bacillus spizizenii]
MEKPTPKQMQTIGYIQENLNVVFTGDTKADARSFISEYMDESREASRSFNSNIECSNDKLRDSDRREMESWILGSVNNRVFCPYDDEEDYRPF